MAGRTRSDIYISEFGPSKDLELKPTQVQSYTLFVLRNLAEERSKGDAQRKARMRERESEREEEREKILCGSSFKHLTIFRPLDF